jgi:hypothetical protein
MTSQIAGKLLDEFRGTQKKKKKKLLTIFSHTMIHSSKPLSERPRENE